jgi:hypothetical protein
MQVMQRGVMRPEENADIPDSPCRSRDSKQRSTEGEYTAIVALGSSVDTCNRPAE